MTRKTQYDILFEPVKIGPVVAPNRFYQTPHATGMGANMPNSSAAMRSIKAEGGWGVVCTEYCSIHPSSDDAPFAYLTLWDDADSVQLKLTADAIHKHGSLAGIELWHGGIHANNRASRLAVIGAMDSSAHYANPAQARAMSYADIQQFRQWHRAAAVRAMQADYDIVYVYAGHDYLPFQFLSPRYNQRKDAYGGCLDNRMRLLRELIEDTRDAVGERCAVAVRLAIDELHGDEGIASEAEGIEIITRLAELPDLWDIALGGGLGNDSCSSRFCGEGFQQKYVNMVKKVTSKPVVSVGRFTSPDTMVSQITRGVQDFIGAARPSIADPFLPKKINTGREDEIRECIGCNICRSANNEGVPLRCTQNPTMGEEWRRGWHPDIIPKYHAQAHILVVGGGPSGLEASLALAQRGYQVTLAEAGEALGGRVNHESSLPGLQSWIRVRDYREHLINKMANIDVYLGNRLSTAEVDEIEVDQVVIATGSKWRRDGVGTHRYLPIPLIDGSQNVYTADDVFAGVQLDGEIFIYDDEHYAIAGLLAEKFLLEGHSVTYMTPAATISSWTSTTDEQAFIQRRLMSMGLQIVLLHSLDRVESHHIQAKCVYTGDEQSLGYKNLILVTGRQSSASQFDQLTRTDISLIGDCLVPSSIADAVYSGHKFARELGVDPRQLHPRRERAVIQPDHIGVQP